MANNKKSEKRLQMGEERWAEHQRKLGIIKTQQWRKNNKEKYLFYKRNTKQQLIDYKGGKCEHCGYDKKCPGVYHFHHKNPEEKDFTIGKRSFSFEKVKSEIDKCLLLCANCHAEIHDKIFLEQKENSFNKL